MHKRKAVILIAFILIVGMLAGLQGIGCCGECFS